MVSIAPRDPRWRLGRRNGPAPLDAQGVRARRRHSPFSQQRWVGLKRARADEPALCGTANSVRVCLGCPQFLRMGLTRLGAAEVASAALAASTGYSGTALGVEFGRARPRQGKRAGRTARPRKVAESGVGCRFVRVVMTHPRCTGRSGKIPLLLGQHKASIVSAIPC